MNEKNKLHNPSVIYVKPRTNKESRDIIQRLHNIGKTEFYNYCYINKDIKPFYSVILLADIVPLHKLFGKHYVFCIDKRKKQVKIVPARMFPPGTMKIRTYKEFMEMDTFELLGSFKEMDSINREAGKLIESGIDLPMNCCERFDIDHGVKCPIPRESIIPPNKIIECRTKEECKWFIEEMEKVSNDNFYKFICAHHLTSHITTGYLNKIFEDPRITSVLFYFSYDKNPFKAYYYVHDEIEVYEEGSIIKASDLMKKEEVK